jgi:alpha-tubulin suppressor-like RCC1 family protein
MVGIGYDTATNSIYVHDTWDNSVHSMTWGGSYAGMNLYAVTVIHLATPTEYSLNISSTSGGKVTTPGEGTFAYDEGTVVDLVATPDAMVAAGWGHTVGLESDGSVVAVGYNDYGQCDVMSWTDIVQVAASESSRHTVGLKSDGSVVAVGDNNEGQCNVSSWTNIIQVAAGSGHTVGLRPDGTVIAVGRNVYGQCNVGGWTDIIQIAADNENTVGLKSDGTVIALGDNSAGQCNVASWTGIVQVAAGWCVTVGLKTDGTVVAVGRNIEGQCNVSSWASIIQVAAGYMHTVGLESDGTVVAVGWDDNGSCSGVTSWTDIVQVTAGYRNTVGLTCDGSVVAVGGNPFGQCNVGDWMLFAHHFVNWSGDVGTVADVNSASTTITMNGDYSITANFVKTYDLTTSSTAGGSVTTPGEGTSTYDEGTVVDLVAAPGAMVDAGGSHTVGFRSDGTVVAVGDNSEGQCNVGGLTDTVRVDAGWAHTVGLRSDGTVVAVGDNSEGQCNVGGWTDVVWVDAGWAHTVGVKSDGTVVAVGYNSYGQCDVGGWTDIVQVDAGSGHTVGLKDDGTVVAVGQNDDGQCDVLGWTNITQVAAGYLHTAGLKSDGTVAVVGDNTYGQCNVGGWMDIVQVDADGWSTVGLKDDGTVVAVGLNAQGQCNVGGWTNIVQVAAGCYHTVGLKDDGTVVAVGSNYYGQCNVSWTNITQVDAGTSQTVGLESDGTVVAVGDNSEGQCDVGSWTGVTQVAAGGYHTVGVRADSTVVAVGDNNSDSGQCNVGGWTDITKVAAGWCHTVGLKDDGTVVTVGYNSYGQCDLNGWMLFAHRFVNWTGDVGTIADVNDATTTITMNGDYSITANFVALYDLTTSSTAGGSVTTPSEGTFTYDEGTVVDLVATPDSGYRFDEWTGDVGTIADVNAASTNITMNGDYSIAANFVAIYDIITSSTAGGSVTTPGEDTFTYDEGTVVDLVAEADTCYEFVNWTGDVGTIADVYAASTNITMNANKNVTANFALLSYNLTAGSTDGGSITDPGEGTFNYNCGDVVDLVATPDEGYRFDEWTGDVSTIGNVTAASTNITMNGGHSITAKFVAIYDLTTSSTAGGSVTTPGEDTYTYDGGTVVDLVATPGAGYRFVNWTGDVGTIADVYDASTTITMNGDHEITANFVALYDLTIDSTVGGNVTTPGEGLFPDYDAGTVVDLVATPDEGYRFDEWTGDVGTIADVNAATTNITMNGNYAITANFVALYDLTIDSTVGGNVATPGEGLFPDYDAGTVVDLVATPDAMIAAGLRHTVGLESDGTVVAVGDNGSGQCNVSSWTDIIQAAAGVYHTVGLKSDGTVVAVGDNGSGQCNVGGWTDIDH